MIQCTYSSRRFTIRATCLYGACLFSGLWYLRPFLWFTKGISHKYFPHCCITWNGIENMVVTLTLLLPSPSDLSFPTLYINHSIMTAGKTLLSCQITTFSCKRDSNDASVSATFFSLMLLHVLSFLLTYFFLLTWEVMTSVMVGTSNQQGCSLGSLRVCVPPAGETGTGPAPAHTACLSPAAGGSASHICAMCPCLWHKAWN